MNKGSLVPNPNHETRKTRIRTQQLETKIQQDFIVKINKTRLWQENIPKTDVEQTKSNEEFYLYLYLLGT